MNKNRVMWSLGLMGAVCLAGLQGCSSEDPADAGNGGTGPGSAGSAGSAGSTSAGGTAGTTGGTAGGGAGGTAGTTGGTAGGGAGGTAGGGAGGTAGGGAGGTAGGGAGGTAGGGGTGGASPNAAKCTTYCSEFATKCPTLNTADYAGNTCQSSCEAMTLGTVDANSGNTIECRLWHLDQIASGTDNVPHCGHAKKTPTEGCI